MSEFFKGRGFKVLVAVFVLLFGMIIGSLLKNGTAGTVDGIVGVLVTPVRVVSNAVGGFFEGIGSNFENRKALQDRVDELTNENAELKNQIVDYQEMKDENERLRELVGLKEKNEDAEITFAAVISHDNDPYSHTVGINGGSIDGISVGDPVITKDNFLIGYVSKVGATWSTVTTVLDVTANVGVSLASSGESGVTETDTELSRRGMVNVVYLPKDTAVSRGEMVITSGLSGHYPEGLILGTVESITLSEDGLSSVAAVKPAADIASVKDVFIITDFAGQGEEAEGK